MIACVLLPRFELVVALGGREELAAGPSVIAPIPGRAQLVGEASPAAEALGIHAGMRLGEALARCPSLRLVPGDPARVADAWERAITGLESIGARVEPADPGCAFFDAAALKRLHGRDSGGLAWLDGVVAAVRRALAIAARIGAGPTRFCALVAAARAGSRKLKIVGGEADLAAEPVALLRARIETAPLVGQFERLGLTTLGEVAGIGRARLADRFGPSGAIAHDLARGLDTPLVPRVPGETIEESFELLESASGSQLERALGVLIDRILARRERNGRTLRSVAIAARLVEGGTWRVQVVFREALSDPARIRLALAQQLEQLPAPAEKLRLSVVSFGSPFAVQPALFDDGDALRRVRLRDAVSQARAAAGPDAALRVLQIDPGSRVPERRSLLTPFEP